MMNLLESDLNASQQLSRNIKQEMIQMPEQWISFSRFMELALYDSKLGYYNAHSTIFGPKGDFTTAPEISSLFSRCLAHYTASVLSQLSTQTPAILEIGAGTGQLAVDYLLELEALDCLPKYYYIFEISQKLVQAQKKYFGEKIPHLLNRICHIEALPIAPIEGVIIANEVIDALPVHLFHYQQGVMKERGVSFDQHAFVWQAREPQSDPLIERLEQLKTYFHKEQDYLSEVNLGLPQWIQSLRLSLKVGCVLLIDYGFSEQNYYHPERDRGTLQCYYRHQLDDNPLHCVGQKDITCHVNFTEVAHHASKVGFQTASFISQAAFLLSCGVLHLSQTCDMQTLHRHQGHLHQLLSPDEMGEVSKVMILTSHEFELQFPMLKEYDRRGRL